MPRNTLTKEQIVTAAVELLDADGLDGLNMRSLGARLGSAATAVYWHVQSKENLVVLAADHVWSEIELPAADLELRAAATMLANGLYAMVGRHSWLVPAMSSHLIFGPRKARYDDRGLAVYESAGFAGPAAVSALATVYRFVLGKALEEASAVAWRQRVIRGGGDPEQEMATLRVRASEVAREFPTLLAHMAAAEQEEPEDDFAFGLTTILDGLQARYARAQWTVVASQE